MKTVMKPIKRKKIHRKVWNESWCLLPENNQMFEGRLLCEMFADEKQQLQMTSGRQMI